MREPARNWLTGPGKDAVTFIYPSFHPSRPATQIPGHLKVWGDGFKMDLPQVKK